LRAKVFNKDFKRVQSQLFWEDNNNIQRYIERKAIIKITGWFLTKWQNIDPYGYFMCGFDLYKKNFSYVKFFDEKILLLYITRDKNKKRDINITKKKMIESAVFVKKWMVKNNATLYDYINAREGHLRMAVDHYLKNQIDASFFVFLIGKGMILTDMDRSQIPYIQQKFRKIQFGLNDIRDFIKKLEGRLL
jgi:hypothetical protein